MYLLLLHYLFYYGKEHNTILLFVAFCVLAEMEVLNYVKNTKK